MHDAKVDVKGIYACTVGYGIYFEWTCRYHFTHWLHKSQVLVSNSTSQNTNWLPSKINSSFLAWCRKPKLIATTVSTWTNTVTFDHFSISLIWDMLDINDTLIWCVWRDESELSWDASGQWVRVCEWKRRCHAASSTTSRTNLANDLETTDASVPWTKQQHSAISQLQCIELMQMKWVFSRICGLFCCLYVGSLVNVLYYTRYIHMKSPLGKPMLRAFYYQKHLVLS